MPDRSIIVNGEPRPLGQDATVASLLADLGIECRKVAIERNLEIVPRSSFAATALTPGDRIEVVSFVGGG